MRDHDSISRRSFLQAAGFTLATAAAGCTRAPERSRVAHLVQPEAAEPGTRLHYATTCGGCSAGCGVLASVRDGRPVKLEGLPAHPVSRGGLCAAGQASILGLYDAHRVRQPLLGGEPVPWSRIDALLKGEFATARGAVRLLTGTDAAASPSTRALIARFLAKFADGRHDVYDVLSGSAIADAHQATHGVRAIPRIRFDRAQVVAAFEADFLGTWISPVEFAGAYAARRPRMHLQVESRMTLTGSKADRRIVVTPGDIGAVMTALAVNLAQRADFGFDARVVLPPGFPMEMIEQMAEALWRVRGRALVVCGSENTTVQRLAILVNELLDAYGSTLDLTRPTLQRSGDDRSVERLMLELERGAVDVLIASSVNPVHELPDGGRWGELLEAVPTLVAVSERIDETASLARYVCPPPHPLESWGDYEPVAGTLCLRQPTMAALGDTRSLDASLATWSGSPLDALELLQRHWRDHVFDPSSDGASFDAFWDRSLRDGWITRAAKGSATQRFDPAAVSAMRRELRPAAGTLVLAAYPSVALMDGRQGYNPWLLELPDPLTKVTWESCASLSPVTARGLGVRDGDLVRIVPVAGTGRSRESNPERSIEVPVVVQPGQHDDVVAVPVGFGQLVTRRFAGIGPDWMDARRRGVAGPVGANVASLLGPVRSGDEFALAAVRVFATGRHRDLPRTQTNGRLSPDGDDAWAAEGAGALIRFVDADPETRPNAGVSTGHAARNLWGDGREYAGARWGMVIDLDACTGCSACVVACQVENNTPVVGRDEVRRRREMHWLRIDRYYVDGAHGVAVAHQPMTCHHCGNAPCESVCPVLATTHSSDGLNQQTYSRCIGTRYCMNNCPFKVRAFNWFDYARDERLENLVLNPEVTVRSRGVAEKCTFCVQRIQEARLDARMRGATPADGDVMPACAQTCAASALTFGDLNDPHSRVHRLAGSGSAYTLLDGLNLQPAIRYLPIRRREGPVADDVDRG